MAQFVLTAQLQLQSPTNANQVLADVRRQLTSGGGINIPVEIKGASQAQSAIKKITAETNKAATAAQSMGRSFGLAIKRFAAFTVASRAVSLLTNSMAGAVDEAIKFEQEMIKISQVTGRSVKELQGLQKTITSLSTGLGVSSKDILGVGRILAQAGIRAKNLDVALTALAKTTLAPTFTDITKTAEGAVAIIAQFEQGVGSLEKQLGAINAVAGQFAVESDDLIGAVRRFGGVFKSAGGDLNELLALFTSVRATTRESAESIGTGLRTIFTRIQRPKTIAYLKELGIELTDANGRFIGAFEAVRKLSQALGNLPQGDLSFIRVAEELGGFRQIGKIIPLLQNFEMAERARQVAIEGGTSLDKDAVKAQQALANQITKVKEEFLALTRSITQSTSFQVFTRTALELAKAMIQIGKAVAPLIPLITAFAAIKFTKGIGGFLGGAGKGLGLGKAHGGIIKQFARGGLVPGYGNGDTVPAMLSPGEFVIRKSSVKKIGQNRLAGMNKYGGGGSVTEAKDFYSVGLRDRVVFPRKEMSGRLKDPKTQINSGDKFRSTINRPTYADRVPQGWFNKKTRQGAGSQINPEQFEQYVAGTTAGMVEAHTLGFGKNAPVDVMNSTGSKLLEVKRTVAEVPDSAIRDKTIRAMMVGQTKKGATPGTLTGRQDSILLPQVDVAQPSSTKLDGRKSALLTAMGLKKVAEKAALGGLIQKFAMGGIAKTNKVGAAILDPDKNVKNETKRIGPNSVKKYIGGSGFDKNRAQKGFGKVFPGKDYTLVRQGLNEKTSKGFKASLLDGVSQGLGDAVAGLSEDLGLGSASFKGGGKAEMGSYFGSRAIGEIYEAGVNMLTNKGVFKNSPVSAPWDFPGGLSGKISDNFDKMPSSWVDAKSSYAAAGTAGMFNKVSEELADEYVRSGEYAKAVTKRAASGGGISGSDTVPALLTPGEFVVNKKSAQGIGYANLNRMNKRGVTGFHAGGYVGIQKFAKGGSAGGGMMGDTGGMLIGLSLAAGAAQTAISKFGDTSLEASDSMAASTIAAQKITEGFVQLAVIVALVSKARSIGKSGQTTEAGAWGGGPKQQKKALEKENTERRRRAEIKKDQEKKPDAVVTDATAPAPAPGAPAPGAAAPGAPAPGAPAPGAPEKAIPESPKTTAKREMLAKNMKVNMDKKRKRIGETEYIEKSIHPAEVKKHKERREEIKKEHARARKGGMKKEKRLRALSGDPVTGKGGLAMDKKLELTRARKTKKEAGGVFPGSKPSAWQAHTAKEVDRLEKEFKGLQGEAKRLTGSIEKDKNQIRALGKAHSNNKKRMATAEQALKKHNRTLKKAAVATEKARRDTQNFAQRGLERMRIKFRPLTTQIKAANIQFGRMKMQIGRFNNSLKGGFAAGLRGATKAAKKAGKRIKRALQAGVGRGRMAMGKGAAGMGVGMGALMMGSQIFSGISQYRQRQADQAKASGDVTGSIRATGAKEDADAMSSLFSLGGLIEAYGGEGGLSGWADRNQKKKDRAEARAGVDVAVMNQEMQLKEIKKGEGPMDVAAVTTKMGSDAAAARGEIRQLRDDEGNLTPEAIKMQDQLNSGIKQNVQAMIDMGASEKELMAQTDQLAGTDAKFHKELVKMIKTSIALRAAQRELNKANFDSLKITSAFAAGATAVSVFNAGLVSGGDAMAGYIAEMKAARETIGLDASDSIKNTRDELMASIPGGAGSALGASLSNQADVALATNAFSTNVGRTVDAGTIRTGMGADAVKEDLTKKLMDAIPKDADPAVEAQIRNMIEKRVSTINNANIQDIDLSKVIADVSKDANQLSDGFFKAAQMQAKHNSQMSKLYAEREKLEARVAAAQNKAIETQLEAAKIFEEAGGSKLTTQQKTQARVAQFNNTGGLGGLGAQLGSGSSADIKRVAAQIGQTFQNQSNAFSFNTQARGAFGGGQGTFTGPGGLAADKRPEAQNANAALIQFTKQRIGLLKEELTLVKQKNAAEKSSLDKLLAGDIEGFIAQQEAAGAAAALMTGDKGLANMFNATSLGAGFAELQKQGADAKTLRTAETNVLGAFGVTGTGVLSGTTPEEEAANAEIRELAGTLGDLAQQEAGFAKAELQIQDAIIEATNVTFARGIRESAQETGTFSRGGVVYANRGMFVPRGTDTVPAMLTPGEFIVNRGAVNRGNNLQILNAMNSSGGGGASAQGAMSGGGPVKYYQDGGIVAAITSAFSTALPNLQTIFTQFNDSVEKLKSSQFSVQLDPTTVTVNLQGGSFLEMMESRLKASLMEDVGRQIANMSQNNTGDFMAGQPSIVPPIGQA